MNIEFVINLSDLEINTLNVFILRDTHECCLYLICSVDLYGSKRFLSSSDDSSSADESDAVTRGGLRTQSNTRIEAEKSTPQHDDDNHNQPHQPEPELNEEETESKDENTGPEGCSDIANADEHQSETQDRDTFRGFSESDDSESDTENVGDHGHIIDTPANHQSNSSSSADSQSGDRPSSGLQESVQHDDSSTTKAPPPLPPSSMPPSTQPNEDQDNSIHNDTALDIQMKQSDDAAKPVLYFMSIWPLWECLIYNKFKFTENQSVRLIEDKHNVWVYLVLSETLKPKASERAKAYQALLVRECLDILLDNLNQPKWREGVDTAKIYADRVDEHIIKKLKGTCRLRVQFDKCIVSGGSFENGKNYRFANFPTARGFVYRMRCLQRRAKDKPLLSNFKRGAQRGIHEVPKASELYKELLKCHDDSAYWQDVIVRDDNQFDNVETAPPPKRTNMFVDEDDSEDSEADDTTTLSTLKTDNEDVDNQVKAQSADQMEVDGQGPESICESTKSDLNVMVCISWTGPMPSIVTATLCASYRLHTLPLFAMKMGKQNSKS